MATRSYIGKLNPETNTVTYIYCHYDGYLSHNGRLLSENYNDKDKVNQLLELGDLSYLDEQIGEKHDFKKPTEGWTVSYSRDRGEQFQSSRSTTKLEDYNRDPGIDYFYLFTEEGWKYSTGNGWNKIEIEKIEA
jgi:hypothetical protein